MKLEKGSKLQIFNDLIAEIYGVTNYGNTRRIDYPSPT